MKNKFIRDNIVGTSHVGYPHFDFICNTCNEQTNTYGCDYIILGRVVGFVCDKCKANNYLSSINRCNKGEN